LEINQGYTMMHGQPIINIWTRFNIDFNYDVGSRGFWFYIFFFNY